MADEDKDKKVEETPPEETPKEEPAEETPAEETPVEETPEVKVEIAPEEIAAEVKSEFTKKILDAIGMTTREAVDEDLLPPWEKEKRNPKSYGEIAEWSAELADKRAEQRKAKEAEDAKAVEAGNVEAQTTYNQALNRAWDEQLDEMREAGLIPRVDATVAAKLKARKELTEDEKADPGLAAQRRMFEIMYNVSQERGKVGKSPITSLKEVFYEYYSKEEDQPAGADAPISGGEKAVAHGRNNELDYDDIRTKDFYTLIRGG